MTDKTDIENCLTKAKDLFLLEAYDRDTGATLFLKGKAIMEVNYDEHGSAGSDLMRGTAERLAKALDLDLVREEVDDETYSAVLAAA